MVSKLSVQNFALIENAQIEWKDGFTVITGETGSGKSILLGALRLIMGERADYSVIRNKEKKTVVEATFLLQEKMFRPFFIEQDWDFDDETIIRREISATGKSRAFINDTPVQLMVLKSLTDRLIHIHSQHHTIALKDKKFQCSLLDSLAENEDLLAKYRKEYFSINKLQKEIEELNEKLSNLNLEAEFNQFQLAELEKLGLESTNFETIQRQVDRGEQFEEIKQAYSAIAAGIQLENGVVEQLNDLLRAADVKDEKVQLLVERIRSVLIELKDIGDSAEDDLSELSSDPSALAANIQKLDAYNAALRKHRLQYQDELITLYYTLKKSIGGIDEIAEEIQAKNEALDKIRKGAHQSADKLSLRRKECAKKIEHEVISILNQLKLNDAFIQFQFSEGQLQSFGKDQIDLLFAPNKGIAPQPVEKAASGGELSRLMLVIQYLLSQKKQLPTILFDEIDTGVSGEVAQRIGELLQKMGKFMQLIAITHLPQVAGKGNHHLKVRKYVENEITQTQIAPLNQEERIIEIAKLMSGSKINDAALSNAKNLMDE